MAIERYMLATTNDLKELVESLEWFDKVEIDQNNTGEVVCSLGDDTYTEVMRLIGPTGKSGSACAFNTGTRTITMGTGSVNYRPLIYAFKTKNGLLLTHDEDSCFSQVLLGKTNNSDIACCMSTNTTDGATFLFYTAAVGETDQYIGTSSRIIDIGSRSGNASTASRYRWTSSPQITACQIPTCPSSGTSYIKGALMLVTTNMDGLGTVEINGVQYATTGDLCLNDED